MRKYLVVGAICISTCAALLVTGYVAEGRLGRLVEESNAALSALMFGVQTLDTGLVSQMAVEDLERFTREYPKQRDLTQDSQQKLSSGDGMFFWFKARRLHASAHLATRLRSAEAIFQHGPQALNAVSVAHSHISAVVRESASARQSAQVATNPMSDATDFQRAADGIEIQLRVLRSVSVESSGEQVSSRGAGLGEELHSALLQGLIAKVQGETEQADSRLQLTRQAATLLAGHKLAIRTLIEADKGALFQSTAFVQNVRPGIVAAREYSAPLQGLINQASTPLVEGVAGRVLGAVVGAKNLSPRGLLASAHPIADRAVGAIGEFCGLIETLERESAEFSGVNAPLVAAIQSFGLTESRQEMLALATVSQRAADYYSSKSKLFDPSLEKLASLDAYLAGLVTAIDKISTPDANAQLQSIAGSARRLVQVVGQPFDLGKQVITDMSGLLKQLCSHEAAYIARISHLRG